MVEKRSQYWTRLTAAAQGLGVMVGAAPSSEKSHAGRPNLLEPYTQPQPQPATKQGLGLSQHSDDDQALLITYFQATIPPTT